MLTLLSECSGADQVGSVDVGGGQRDMPSERLQALKQQRQNGEDSP
jgi:hypothetical protein